MFSLASGSGEICWANVGSMTPMPNDCADTDITVTATYGFRSK